MGKKKKKQKDRDQPTLMTQSYEAMEDSALAAVLRKWAGDVLGDDRFLLETAADRLTRPTEGECPVCGREMGDLDAPGTTASRPQATSRAAGEIRRGSDRAEVLLFMLAVGHATADAVAAGLKKSPNEVAARLLELRNGGYVQYVKQDGKKVRRRTRSGRSAYVQALSVQGLRKARELREAQG